MPDPTSPDESQSRTQPSDHNSVPEEDDEARQIVRDVEQRLSEEIPEQEQSKVRHIVQEVIRERRFSGPQPPPELLAEYERICPGWGSKLLQMGLDEQKHRHNREDRVLEQDDRMLDLESREATYSLVALVLGFVAFLVIAGLGVYALRLGHEKTAIALFGTFSVGVVMSLINGRVWSSRRNGRDIPKDEN